MRFPKWRKATWALVIWCVLILVWAISGAAANDCASGDSACEAGTGIGVALILLMGFFGFVFLSFIWLMSRPKNRQCPQCGNDVKRAGRRANHAASISRSRPASRARVLS